MRISRDAFGFVRDGLEPIPRERAVELLATRIGEAISEGDDAAVRRWVAEGAEILGEYRGLTSDLMRQAAQSGRVGATATLLEAGAEVDWANEDGGTALMSAAWDGHLEV